MENNIIIAILVPIIGGAIGYIIKAKKSGAKCIGCPYAKECTKGSNSCRCKDSKTK
jgi:hypothetical protein